jgi:hypothetical protein
MIRRSAAIFIWSIWIVNAQTFSCGGIAR